ncbi:MAG: 2-C-methyl-D-erythritol 4-phosphate cytidylyltransferase [Spirochaetes bacterium]|nr:2-C-methyl-D-erythritol 4-phosphate cytidylyltransferase [Spirochaetota bacterium]
MKVFAVILAGGSGSRLNSEKPKQLMTISGKPVIIYSAEVFNNHPMIDEIICISNSEFLKEIESVLQSYKINKLTETVPGGNTRQKSSYAAVNLPLISNKDIILIHDAARPFINTRMIDELIRAAVDFGCSGTYINSTDTVAIVKNNFVSEIPSRNEVFLTQTPQAFKAEIIRECHKKAINDDYEVTDDAGLVLKYGYKVKFVEGSINNFKITNFGDIEKAELVLKEIK